MLYASKLLVRTILEATFSAKAAIVDAGFLWNKFYTEQLETVKLTAESDEERRKGNEDAKSEFLATLLAHAAEFPAQQGMQPRKTDVFEAASIAGMKRFYDFDYRIYCQFTHSALGAISGDFTEDTDKGDTPLIVICILLILEGLKKHTPAEVGELQEFWNRVKLLPDPTTEQKS